MQGFQDYIKKHCLSTVVPVELQKLARAPSGWCVAAAPTHAAMPADGCRQLPAQPQYRFLHPLGEQQPGEPHASYLAVLAKVCFSDNIQLFVFNSVLKMARLQEWVKW